MEIDEDDEYNPSAEDIAEEEEEEPLLMANAGAWDNFLAYVHLVQEQWADPESDTDIYRKEMALKYFNAGAFVARPALPRHPLIVLRARHR